MCFILSWVFLFLLPVSLPNGDTVIAKRISVKKKRVRWERLAFSLTKEMLEGLLPAHPDTNRWTILETFFVQLCRKQLGKKQAILRREIFWVFK